MSRCLSVVVAVTLLAGVAATAALAHVNVKSTSPKRNGTAKVSAGVVTITFSGPLLRGTLKVVGPGGQASVGGGGRDPRNIKRLAVALKGGLKPGRYRASWTLVAADTHRQKGAFAFGLGK